MQAAIAQGMATVKKAGKAAGTLTADRRLARQYLAQGALFVAVGVDTTMLVKAAKELAAEFNGASAQRRERRRVLKAIRQAARASCTRLICFSASARMAAQSAAATLTVRKALIPSCGHRARLGHFQRLGE